MKGKSIKLELRAQTGVRGLDDILTGGLPHGHFFLLEGAPGTGKTTLALQFLLEGIKAGEAGLYITLSESKEELDTVAASHGWSLDKISLFDLQTHNEADLPDGQYTFFHPSEIELGETTKSLIEAFERVKPRRVVFDSLSELRLLARDPLTYRRQVLALKQYFTNRNCTVLVLDDLTSGQSDLQPQSLAHGVISLETNSPDYGAYRRRLKIAKLRGSDFRSGFHDYVIERGGLKVFPRLIASEHGFSFDEKTANSGSPELDRLLGGGLDYGSSQLILGPAGCGKSSIALHFAVAAIKRGEKAAIFLFDETERTYLKRAASLGLDIKPFIESGEIQLKQIDPAEMAPGQFAQHVRESVEKNGACCVIIDSLSGYMHAMPEERSLILHVHEMLSYLSQMGVLTIMVAVQHGMVGRLHQGPFDLSYIADSIFILRYFEARGKVRRAISVLKKRTGKHEDVVREFSFSEDGLTVGPPLENFQGILSGSPRMLKLSQNGKANV